MTEDLVKDLGLGYDDSGHRFYSPRQAAARLGASEGRRDPREAPAGRSGDLAQRTVYSIRLGFSIENLQEAGP